MSNPGPGPEGAAVVHLDLEDGYRFVVDLGEGLDPLWMDEPAPLGAGSAANASAVLGAAVGNCLSASLTFCLRRAHVEISSLHTDVTVTPTRNEEGRLRIGTIGVDLHLGVGPGGEGRLQRCLELFEDFCVVTGAVREGIPVSVSVEAAGGGEGVAASA